MARKLAPTKVTSGSGYLFEDKVTAFFISYLLSSIPPLDPVFGTIFKIELQKKVDGWILDDILLCLKNESSEIKCALSVKSNQQFTKSTAPQDFVRDAWEQYLEDHSCFTRGQDRLGLVTAQLDTNTKTKLEDLLKKARVQEPEKLRFRINQKGYVSKEEKRLHDSFACPQDFQEKYSDKEYLPGELLKYIEHLDFDFDHTSSRDFTKILSALNNLFEEANIAEAQKFWETLCSIAKEASVGGGYLDLPTIIQKVRNTYKLKDFPDHRHWWDLIYKKNIEEIGLIKDTIGEAVTIDRSEVLSDIKLKLENDNHLLLLGVSGVGKTVVQKKMLTQKVILDKVIWVNTENLVALAELPFRQIARSAPDKQPILIVDGIDRFYTEIQFKKVALIIKNIGGDEDNSPWKIIISCQPEEWQRVQANLMKFNVSYQWQEYTIKNPDRKLFKQIWEKYPALEKLSFHLHLQQLLLKPKILDLFANRIDCSGIINTEYFDSISSQKVQLGESHLISWFWNMEVINNEEGIQKSHFMKWLAKKMADDLSTSVDLSEIEFSYIPFIDALIKNKTLKKRNGKVSFEHDLIADWARQRILMNQTSKIHKFLKDRLTSPSWCKALRLMYRI